MNGIEHNVVTSQRIGDEAAQGKLF